MFGTGDEGQDFFGRQRRIDVGPGPVRIIDQRAVLAGNLRGECQIPLRRREVGIGRAVLLAGENDAVITDADFDNFCDTGVGAGREFLVADLARSVGDVDGILADAFAKPLQTGGGAARLHHRGREAEVFAEGFGDDGRIGQNSGRPGDLDLFARCGHGGREGDDGKNRNAGFVDGHGMLLIGI